MDCHWEITSESTQLNIYKCEPVAQKCRCTIVYAKDFLNIIHPINVSITLTRLSVPNLPDENHENRVIRQSTQK